ncbi:MAG: NAD-dependent epimerase/dehydratase family protein, partial [Candidatus Omnitrophota bacterium]
NAPIIRGQTNHEEGKLEDTSININILTTITVDGIKIDVKAKVLVFGLSVSSPIKTVSLSELDKTFQLKWLDRWNEGVFLVTSEQMERTKTQRKIGPFTVRLTPHEKKLRKVDWADLPINLNLPFDPEKFNFSKIKPEEVLVDGIKLAGNNWRVIINASPTEKFASLLVPAESTNQSLFKKDIFALSEFLGLTKARVIFNSLWAGASVNSKHFQIYYSEMYGFEYIEKIEGIIWNQIGDVSVADLRDYPGNIFAVRSDDRNKLANAVWLAIEYMKNRNIPHNIIGKDNIIVVMPTRTDLPQVLEGQPIAAPEKLGLFNIISKSLYEKLTISDLVLAIGEGSLPEYDYSILLADYLGVLKERNFINGDNLSSSSPIGTEEVDIHNLADVFSAKNRLFFMVNDLANGSEIHIITAGGGGDILGGIFLAVELKHILRIIGKKDIKFTIFTTNLKRGEENPDGGPTPMKAMNIFIKGGIKSPIEKMGNSKYFYWLNNLNTFVYVKANGNEVPYPVKESKIIGQVKERWGFDIAITDISASGKSLADDYVKLIEGKSVFIIGLDMGGDILAQYPYAKTDENKARHTERNVKSPVTDTVSLEFFYNLAIRGEKVVLAVSALGGDGELGETLKAYLDSHYDNKSIMGVLDNYKAMHNKIDLLRSILELNISSEVSTNLLRRLEHMIKGSDYAIDFTKDVAKITDWAVANNHRDNLWSRKLFEFMPYPFSGQTIRGGTRTELLPYAYLHTIFMDVVKVRNMISSEAKEIFAQPQATWLYLEKFLREKLGYTTEWSDDNNVQARDKATEYLRRIVSKLQETPAQSITNAYKSIRMLFKKELGYLENLLCLYDTCINGPLLESGAYGLLIINSIEPLAKVLKSDSGEFDRYCELLCGFLKNIIDDERHIPEALLVGYEIADNFLPVLLPGVKTVEEMESVLDSLRFTILKLAEYRKLPVYGEVAAIVNKIKSLEAVNIDSVKGVFVEHLEGAIKGNSSSPLEEKLEKFFNLDPGPFSYEREVLANHWARLRNILKGKYPIPYEIEVQPINKCNMNCIHCIGGEFRPQGKVFISLALMNSLVDKIMAYNANNKDKISRVKFSGFYGDPLVAYQPTVLGIRRLIRAGVEVGLFTNGLLLAKEIREVLMGANYVHISLDADTGEALASIKRTNPSNFNLIMNNIKELCKLRENTKSKLKIVVGYVLHRENIKGISLILRNLKDIGVDIVRFKMNILSDEEQALDAKELDEAFNSISAAKRELETEKFKVIAIHSKQEATIVPKPDFARCYFGSFMGAVGCDAKVYPCDHRTYQGGYCLGDLHRKDSLQKIYGRGLEEIFNQVIPHRDCTVCPPMGNRINRLLAFIETRYQENPAYLNYIERNYVIPFKREIALEAIKNFDFVRAIKLYRELTVLYARNGDKQGKELMTERLIMWQKVKSILHNQDNRKKTQKFTVKTILITGATGFIGNHLVNSLINCNASNSRIILLGRTQEKINQLKEKVSPRETSKEIIFEVVDLRDKIRVGQILKKYRPDLVYHLASQVNLRTNILGEIEEIYDVNVGGMLNLISGMNKMQKFSQLIFTSTTRVYGKPVGNMVTIDENKPAKPIFPYEISKYIAEQLMIRKIGRRINYYILRVVNAIPHLEVKDGKPIYKDIVSKFIKDTVDGKSLEVFSNYKEAKINFISIDDLANILIQLVYLNKLQKAIINIGSGNTISIAELIEAIRSITSLDIRLNILDKIGYTDNVSYGVVYDIQKLRILVDHGFRDFNQIIRDAFLAIKDDYTKVSSPIINGDVIVSQLERIKKAERIFDNYSDRFRFETYLIGGLALHLVNGRISDTRDIDFAIEGKGRLTPAEGEMFECLCQELRKNDTRIHLASMFPYGKVYKAEGDNSLIYTNTIKDAHIYNRIPERERGKFVLIVMDDNFRFFINRLLSRYLLGSLVYDSFPSPYLAFRINNEFVSSSPMQATSAILYSMGPIGIVAVARLIIRPITNRQIININTQHHQLFYLKSFPVRAGPKLVFSALNSSAKLTASPFKSQLNNLSISSSPLADLRKIHNKFLYSEKKALFYSSSPIFPFDQKEMLIEPQEGSSSPVDQQQSSLSRERAGFETAVFLKIARSLLNRAKNLLGDSRLYDALEIIKDLPPPEYLNLLTKLDKNAPPDCLILAGEIRELFSSIEQNTFLKALNIQPVDPLTGEVILCEQAVNWIDAHSGEGTWHANVHVLMVNEEGKFIVHNRRDKGNKDLSATGHLYRGESYEEAALRVIKNETGITLPRKNALKALNGIIGQRKIGSSEFRKPAYYDAEGIFHSFSKEICNKEYGRFFLYIVTPAESEEIQKGTVGPAYYDLDGLVQVIESAETDFASAILQLFKHARNREIIIQTIHAELINIFNSIIENPKNQEGHNLNALEGFAATIINKRQDWREGKEELSQDLQSMESKSPREFDRRKGIALNELKSIVSRASILTKWEYLRSLYGRNNGLLSLGELFNLFDALKLFEANTIAGRVLLHIFLKEGLDLHFNNQGYVFTRHNEELPGVWLSAEGKLEIEKRIERGIDTIRKGAIAADMDKTTAPKDENIELAVLNYINQILILGFRYAVVSGNEYKKQLKRSLTELMIKRLFEEFVIYANGAAVKAVYRNGVFIGDTVYARAFSKEQLLVGEGLDKIILIWEEVIRVIRGNRDDLDNNEFAALEAKINKAFTQPKISSINKYFISNYGLDVIGMIKKDIRLILGHFSEILQSQPTEKKGREYKENVGKQLDPSLPEENLKSGKNWAFLDKRTEIGGEKLVQLTLKPIYPTAKHLPGKNVSAREILGGIVSALVEKINIKLNASNSICLAVMLGGDSSIDILREDANKASAVEDLIRKLKFADSDRDLILAIDDEMDSAKGVGFPFLKVPGITVISVEKGEKKRQYSGEDAKKIQAVCFWSVEHNLGAEVGASRNIFKKLEDLYIEEVRKLLNNQEVVPAIRRLKEELKKEASFCNSIAVSSPLSHFNQDSGLTNQGGARCIIYRDLSSPVFSLRKTGLLSRRNTRIGSPDIISLLSREAVSKGRAAQEIGLNSARRSALLLKTRPYPAFLKERSLLTNDASSPIADNTAREFINLWQILAESGLAYDLIRENSSKGRAKAA